jgi:hypothetical protein
MAPCDFRLVRSVSCACACGFALVVSDRSSDVPMDRLFSKFAAAAPMSLTPADQRTLLRAFSGAQSGTVDVL